MENGASVDAAVERSGSCVENARSRFAGLAICASRNGMIGETLAPSASSLIYPHSQGRHPIGDLNLQIPQFGVS